jgi:hypothetical protein
MNIDDLDTIILDVLEINGRRLKEEELEKKLVERGSYSPSRPTSSLRQDMQVVITDLVENNILSTGDTVKTIDGGKPYKPDPKQWIVVNRLDKDFSSITTADEMIAYLGNISRSLRERKYLYTYCRLDKAIRLIKDRRWLIGHASFLNDRYEYERFPNWDGRFQSSFMRSDTETIAMWSMYAQPWDKGVRIGFPVAEFKRWISGIASIYDEHQRALPNNYRIYYSDVLYEEHPLKRGSLKNEVFKPYEHPEMQGHVKDAAWSYEKEVRLHIDVPGMKDEKVFVEVPEKLIDSIEITAGPRFNGNLDARITQETGKTISTSKSKFLGKLKWVYCDDCASFIRESHSSRSF